MRVHYMSDIHLEFDAMDQLPSGEVLILAGDITTAVCLSPETQDSRKQRVRSATLRFFELARKNFDTILYIGGNHEPYGIDIDESQALIERHLGGDGVYYLENKAATIDGVTFLGATLWTDVNNGDRGTERYVGLGLTDFHVISEGGRRFTPRHAISRHQASLEFLKKELAARIEQKVVVVTHHAPSYQGMTERFRRTPVAPGFASDLDDFIVTHPQISDWVFGHTHIVKTFRIGETTLRTNCRGYIGREQTGFVLDAHFDAR
ncbi:MAG: metallophosphoesterase [Pseudomonadota bacterium]